MDQWFSECAHAAFKELLQVAEAEGIKIRFRIKPHFIYGHSPVATRALEANYMIAPLEAPRYDAFNIVIDETEAERLLRILPGSEEMWERLAQAFLEIYDPVGYAPIAA
jgi:hypothetical protein